MRGPTFSEFRPVGSPVRHQQINASIALEIRRYARSWPPSHRKLHWSREDPIAPPEENAQSVGHRLIGRVFHGREISAAVAIQVGQGEGGLSNGRARASHWRVRNRRLKPAVAEA